MDSCWYQRGNAIDTRDFVEIKRRVSQQLETRGIQSGIILSQCCDFDVPGIIDVVKQIREALDAFDKLYFPQP
jgi:hypothetical protein